MSAKETKTAKVKPSTTKTRTKNQIYILKKMINAVLRMKGHANLQLPEIQKPSNAVEKRYSDIIDAGETIPEEKGTGRAKKEKDSLFTWGRRLFGLEEKEKKPETKKILKPTFKTKKTPKERTQFFEFKQAVTRTPGEIGKINALLRILKNAKGLFSNPANEKHFQQLAEVLKKHLTNLAVAYVRDRHIKEQEYITEQQKTNQLIGMLTDVLQIALKDWDKFQTQKLADLIDELNEIEQDHTTYYLLVLQPIWKEIKKQHDKIKSIKYTDFEKAQDFEYAINQEIIKLNRAQGIFLSGKINAVIKKHTSFSTQEQIIQKITTEYHKLQGLTRAGTGGITSREGADITGLKNAIKEFNRAILMAASTPGQVKGELYEYYALQKEDLFLKEFNETGLPKRMLSVPELPATKKEKKKKKTIRVKKRKRDLTKKEKPKFEKKTIYNVPAKNTTVIWTRYKRELPRELKKARKLLEVGKEALDEINLRDKILGQAVENYIKYILIILENIKNNKENLLEGIDIENSLLEHPKAINWGIRQLVDKLNGKNRRPIQNFQARNKFIRYLKTYKGENALFLVVPTITELRKAKKSPVKKPAKKQITEPEMIDKLLKIIKENKQKIEKFIRFTKKLTREDNRKLLQLIQIYDNPNMTNTKIISSRISTREKEINAIIQIRPELSYLKLTDIQDLISQYTITKS